MVGRWYKKYGTVSSFLFYLSAGRGKRKDIVVSEAFLSWCQKQGLCLVKVTLQLEGGKIQGKLEQFVPWEEAIALFNEQTKVNKKKVESSGTFQHPTNLPEEIPEGKDAELLFLRNLIRAWAAQGKPCALSDVAKMYGVSRYKMQRIWGHLRKNENGAT